MSQKSIGAAFALAVVLAAPLWVRYGWRIKPANGQIAVLPKKTELCCRIERNRYGSLNETICHVKLGDYKDKE